MLTNRTRRTCAIRPVLTPERLEYMRTGQTNDPDVFLDWAHGRDDGGIRAALKAIRKKHYSLTRRRGRARILSWFSQLGLKRSSGHSISLTRMQIRRNCFGLCSRRQNINNFSAVRPRGMYGPGNRFPTVLCLDPRAGCSRFHVTRPRPSG